MSGINIEDIYAWLASYKGLPFPVSIKDYLPYKKSQWDNRLSGKVLKKSIYGKNIIMPVSIGGIDLGSGEQGHINIQPMVMIECSKRIAKTTIAGGSYPGTVKEYINLDDYKIKITGVVVNPNQKEYPIEQVEILKELWKRNEALPFNSEITNDLFNYVVIESMTLDELKMSPGMQMYNLQCVSDGVQEVELLRIE